MQREALAIDLHRGRVDQEGHVVAHDLHYGVRALPAVRVEARVDYPQLGCVAGEAPAEVEVRGRRARQVGRVAVAELERIRAAVVKARERFREHRLGRVELAAGQPRNLRDEVRLLARPGCRHALKYMPWT